MTDNKRHELHGKGNIRNKEMTETATASNIKDEPVKSLVALSSMPAPCFGNNIVRSGWSQLPPELLQEIGFLLTEISDLARFCAVCKAWRNAVYTTQAPKPSCLPCLLIEEYDCEKNVFTCSLSLISRSFSDSYADARQLGDVQHRICGTGHGWLVVVSELNMTASDFSIFLLNPLTGIRIYLPSSASCNIPESKTRYAYDYLIATISLLEGSRSPAFGCIVMITWNRSDFSFFRYTSESHEGEWTTVKKTVYYSYYIDSFAYHEEKILALCITGSLMLVDTASLSMTLVDRPISNCIIWAFRPRYTFTKIVEASGDVFLVHCLWCEPQVYVYRLDLTVQPPRWCQTTDIGNNVLFADFYRQLHCVTMEDHVKLDLRKNCIYSVKRLFNESFTHSVEIYQLYNGTVEAFPLRFKSFCSNHDPSWLIPSLI